MAPPPKQPHHLVTLTCPNCGEFDTPVHRYNPARPRHAQAIHYDPRRQLSQIKYVAQKPAYQSRPRWEYDEESVVVCAVGTFDEQTETAGYGVYFGRGSRRNVKKVLGPSLAPQDRTRTVIEAARRALELVAEGVLKEQVDEGRGEREIREVVVLTDSRWLVRAITEKVFEWKEGMGVRMRAGGGFGTRGGGRDDDEPWFEEIMQLHGAVADMERPGRVAVRFWDRKEEIPFEAYDLAKELWDQGAD